MTNEFKFNDPRPTDILDALAYVLCVVRGDEQGAQVLRENVDADQLADSLTGLVLTSLFTSLGSMGAVQLFLEESMRSTTSYLVEEGNR